MKLHPVESSNLEAVGYDEKAGKLHVKFSSGATFIYDAPMGVFDDLMGAESKGSFFARHIKGKFPGVKQ